MDTERLLLWEASAAMARFLTTVLFDVKIYGKHNIPERGGALIVSNHQSYLDPVLLAVQVHRPLNYIAKSELFESPVGNWLLRNAFNSFPVRQGKGDIGAVRETIERLKEGHLLNIFPEGARTETGEIARLQGGVGLIVRRARVPIVPTVITGAYEAWPIGSECFRPFPIRLQYGPAMHLYDLENDEIVRTVDKTLHRMFDELRAGHPRNQIVGRYLPTTV